MQTSSRDIVYLQRNCMAHMVPSGARILLHEGTEVAIVQSLGNTFTVNVYGNLARIEGADADALGKEPINILDELPVDASLEDKVWALLKRVFDPEIPVNIVDLGLIYACRVEEIDDDVFSVFIEMTLTAPGCGMGPFIAEDVKLSIESIPQVQKVEVEFVFEPAWDQSRMSEEAKLDLGML